MGRKTDDADVKKECPSCGLGVALDARICEFCGWDFDEEDEWILQIEKLERDLVLEKQKFEPGTVGSKIESSLHAPAAVKKEQLKASAAKAKLQKDMEEVLGSSDQQKPPELVRPAAPARNAPIIREARREEVVEPVGAKKEEPEGLRPILKTPEPVSATEAPPSGKVRRVRKVKNAPTEPEAREPPVKSRVVRKT